MVTAEEQAAQDLEALKQVAAQQEEPTPEPQEEILSTSDVVLGSEGGTVVLTPDAGDNPGGEWTGDGDSGEEGVGE